MLIPRLKFEVVDGFQVFFLMKDKCFRPFYLLVGHVELDLIRVDF
jgi:hypothetical protein